MLDWLFKDDRVKEIEKLGHKASIVDGKLMTSAGTPILKSKDGKYYFKNSDGHYFTLMPDGKFSSPMFLDKGKLRVYGNRDVDYRGRTIQHNSNGTTTLVNPSTNRPFSSKKESVKYYQNNPINYDEQLVGPYLRTLENADSAGFINGRWYGREVYNPYAQKNNIRNSQGVIKKVFDKNQIGIGLDRRGQNNPLVKQKIQKDSRGEYLSENNERFIRNRSIQEKQDVLDRLLKKNGMSVEISPNKRTIATGLIYHGFGPELFMPGPLYNSFSRGTDQAFSDSVYNFYNGEYKAEYPGKKYADHYSTERAEKHRQFFTDND